jgi:hypothetical protein
MSNLNIQWKLGKPFGIIAILSGFAVLSQIPVIYHAREILRVIDSSYLAAYITVTIASVFIIANAEMVLYEALLIRLRSYDIRDYRAPFLTVTITTLLYIVLYFVIYGIATTIELFGYLDSVAQYAIVQMIALLAIMITVFFYNKRQIKF